MSACVKCTGAEKKNVLMLQADTLLMEIVPCKLSSDAVKPCFIVVFSSRYGKILLFKMIVALCKALDEDHFLCQVVGRQFRDDVGTRGDEFGKHVF